jgi:hypothetical protein
LIGSLF